MIRPLLAATAAFALIPSVLAESTSPLAPGEIIAAAPQSDWVTIDPADLIVMDIASSTPSASGEPSGRRIVIQLLPQPFSQSWVGNIRTLASSGWWDGTSINRVQDNYVVQWGDASEAKPLPEGLIVAREGEYEVQEAAAVAPIIKVLHQNLERMKALARTKGESRPPRIYVPDLRTKVDPYSDFQGFWQGWPIAGSSSVWPVHCYGMVGVGRNLSPDTGSGAELYTVIGHAPRHLDRNIALVGRVVSGIEHLSSLPRGTGPLGFYEQEDDRVPILSVRLASDLPEADRPQYEYLSTESDSFARYADARANRRDAFFIRPTGGADVCNVPVPVRSAAR